ncbi:DUF1223 domain-containing protein [Methyloligella sp. 2.7D]|uniref:DUF1223 domain-containing protein n=1 Tax=unclassified Methyloligella TaxID=2625955 RepID=UPI00157D9C00|nr:DUF1223 domain-containing protein [Methyloligella sp. GL2]QKP76434.1 DUF1223 domain-containing protein [Methyloligella sp. GL2]
MTYRTIFALIVFVCMVAGAGLTAGFADTSRQGSKPVLELFTSQGCSSCPPADKLLGRYAARGDVLALSYSVDYWDYLGWKDTLGSPENSARQRAYAQARGDSRVYTPQIVADGLFHAVGSNDAEVRGAMRSAEDKLAGDKVPVSLHAAGDKIAIDVGAAPGGAEIRHATVWIGTAKSLQNVVIKRGENRGRTIAYHNNVRSLAKAGTWTGKPLRLEVSAAKLRQAGGDRVFALLQQGSTGPIFGAAELSGF